MYTLGHNFVPPPIHAGGLRYHGMAPLLSHLVREKYIEAVAYKQLDVYNSGITFARSEGIIPAPESNHAIHATILEALKAKEAGEAKTILFNLSGHGHFDMAAYDAYFAGKLEDNVLPEENIRKALETIKDYPTID